MEILIAGDFCDKYRVKEYIAKELYPNLFDEVKPIVEKADFSIVNFEFPIVINEGKPIQKCGPNLKGQKKAIDAIKYAGFNVCTLANNHILDQGEICCLDTMRLLKEEGLKIVGAGENLHKASEILYLEKDNKKVALINCCEYEFSIATNTTSGANPLNPIQQYYKILEARNNADFVIVIVHGGHEMYQLPSLRMKETYRFFIDAGADIVINHHQHCYSGYETYKGKKIVYGLGNFLFDNYKLQNSIWNYGYMVLLHIDFNAGYNMSLIPYEQCNQEIKVKLLRDEKDFKNKIKYLNDIINDDKKILTENVKWLEKSRNSSLSIFTPYNSKLFLYLYKRGLLPSFISKKKFLRISNIINCEAHFEKLKFHLRNHLIDLWQKS